MKMGMIPSIYKEEIKQLIEAFVVNAVPRGFVGWFNRETAPEGWTICDGTNGTPNLIGRYPLGATDEIGSLVEAGLPNITGTFNSTNENPSPSGALYSTGTRAGSQDTTEIGIQLGFDASRCSSIYGNSTTVTPPSTKLLPCMKL